MKKRKNGSSTFFLETGDAKYLNARLRVAGVNSVYSRETARYDNPKKSKMFRVKTFRRSRVKFTGERKKRDSTSTAI